MKRIGAPAGRLLSARNFSLNDLEGRVRRKSSRNPDDFAGKRLRLAPGAISSGSRDRDMDKSLIALHRNRVHGRRGSSGSQPAQGKRDHTFSVEVGLGRLAETPLFPESGQSRFGGKDGLNAFLRSAIAPPPKDGHVSTRFTRGCRGFVSPGTKTTAQHQDQQDFDRKQGSHGAIESGKGRRRQGTLVGACALLR